MKKVLLLVLVGLIFSISGLFYMRYIRAQNSSTEQIYTMDEMFDRLIEEARQNNSVEIVIGLKIEVRRESELNASELEQQRAKINQAQQDFDAGVFRPSNSTWFIQRTTAGTLIQSFGQSGDRPVPNAFVP